MDRIIVFCGGEKTQMFPLDDFAIPEWAKYYVVFEFHLT